MVNRVYLPDEMRSRYKLFALFATVLLALSVFAPAAVAGAAATNHEAGNDDGGAGNAPADDGAGNQSNASDAFGLNVSSFVHELLANGTTDNQSIGHMVANFVLANNPAADKIPDHAGPPENGTGPKNATGPPEDAGPPEDRGGDGGGPPDDAGPSGDDGDGDDEEADTES